MSTGAASETKLGQLHEKVANVMIRSLDQIERRQDQWENTDNPEWDPPEAPPALLSVMAKFLADNKITCAPEAGNSVSDLEHKLAEKQKNRRKVVGNVVHLDEV
jgi:NADPH:quinone reductase-like Zn-dependent oxidoreductase